VSDRPVAFITGAAHGQGRAVALALAANGYDIAALDVSKPLDYPGYGMGTPAELESLQDEIGALTLVADVRDDAAVKAAVHKTMERFGRIDLLFNNAGICAYGLAEMEGMTTREVAEQSAGNLLPVPWIEPRDVADAVLDLAGARYVTGTTLVVDAGLLTR
jgi:NAD(P)-dependent dehydrogenase (short-subunit alcohol dehydrogenase family)